MNYQPPAPHQPDEKPIVGRDAHDTIASAGKWTGPTYYGRSQLKPAPFNNWVVGGYIALAGLSGASALIGSIAEAAGGAAARPLGRRSRYLSLLAPTIGSALLVWDLHTPQRFYNMMRVAKKTSPMSIGTWVLLGFTGPAMLAGAAQLVSDMRPRLRWPWRVARAAQVPAALAGIGLATYTASLLASTSTPLWAAAPQSLAVRFGASSVASGAAALALGERSERSRRALDALAVAALSVELASSVWSHETYAAAGVEEALEGVWGSVEKYGVTGLGVAMPLALKLAGLAFGGRGRLSSWAVLAGSLMLRVSIMGAGRRIGPAAGHQFPFLATREPARPRPACAPPPSSAHEDYRASLNAVSAPHRRSAAEDTQQRAAEYYRLRIAVGQLHPTSRCRHRTTRSEPATMRAGTCARLDPSFILSKIDQARAHPCLTTRPLEISDCDGRDRTAPNGRSTRGERTAISRAGHQLATARIRVPEFGRPHATESAMGGLYRLLRN